MEGRREAVKANPPQAKISKIHWEEVPMRQGFSAQVFPRALSREFWQIICPKKPFWPKLLQESFGESGEFPKSAGGGAGTSAGKIGMLARVLAQVLANRVVSLHKGLSLSAPPFLPALGVVYRLPGSQDVKKKSTNPNF